MLDGFKIFFMTLVMFFGLLYASTQGPAQNNVIGSKENESQVEIFLDHIKSDTKKLSEQGQEKPKDLENRAIEHAKNFLRDTVD